MADPVLSTTQEAARLAALRRYQILDTPPDKAFDDINAIAMRLLNVPVAAISLVDTDRIWFKAHRGLEIDQTDRVPGMCASVILDPSPYVVNNAGVDPRTQANPLVIGQPGVRFYAGVPLRTHDGHSIGALCGFDFQPREITAQQIELLQRLASLVMDQMEHRLAARRIGDLNQELQRAHHNMSLQATHDPLTNLLNRSSILAHLEQTLALSQREQQPLTAMVVDVDRFKRINELHGHLVGDQVLVDVARKLNQQCRSSDAIGRIGGEEFLIVMYPCDEAEGQQAAKRFRQAVCSAPINIVASSHCKDVDATVSIGLHASGPQASDAPLDAAQLIRLADEALAAVRKTGRTCVNTSRPKPMVVNAM